MDYLQLACNSSNNLDTVLSSSVSGNNNNNSNNNNNNNNINNNKKIKLEKNDSILPLSTPCSNNNVNTNTNITTESTSSSSTPKSTSNCTETCTESVESKITTTCVCKNKKHNKSNKFENSSKVLRINNNNNNNNINENKENSNSNLQNQLKQNVDKESQVSEDANGKDQEDDEEEEDDDDEEEDSNNTFYKDTTVSPENLKIIKSCPKGGKKSKTTSVVTPFLSTHINDQTINKSNQDTYHKFCYRHNPTVRCNKNVDEAKMTEIQKSLEKFPNRDQEAISHVWSIFSAAPNQHRNLILRGLLSQCCFPQLSLISQEVSELIKIDFIEALPNEISLKILCYLDCQSLCNAAQVSTKWKELADDDRVWRYMCEQHIDRKCPQCGWGLPLLAVKRLRENYKKRKLQEAEITNNGNFIPPPLEESNKKPKIVKPIRKTRPWKSVYSERYKIERNWRKGIYKVKIFKGHKDGVNCIQYDNNTNLMMTGSYDGTVKIWNCITGDLIRTLEGHTKGVKALVFDEQKLITGAMDSYIKVWNYRTGQCISTYAGHEESVLSVDFHDKVIVSGSADKTVKVWHVDTRTCYTLRGHTDWVTSVKIHPQSSTIYSASDDLTVRMWDMKTNKCLAVFGGVENNGHIGQIQSVIPLTIKDKIITSIDGNDTVTNSNPSSSGATATSSATQLSQEHHYQQQLQIQRNNSAAVAAAAAAAATASVSTTTTTPVTISRNSTTTSNTINGNGNNVSSTTNTTIINNPSDNDSSESDNEDDELSKNPDLPTHLLTAALDNTIKLWDVKTRKCIRTQFGHIEGVFSITADNFRIVSGAHDKLVKVWDLQTGQCMHTFGGNSSPVLCVDLCDSRFVSGMENGDVKMYMFDV
ncbi:hypothetical protein B5S31_g4185 [[Candida] boidinii]|nr:hypothetical protein B5S31_g4185 [[Candida] boidinii]OWB77144.1 hypothetical protein B5S32_g1304 [[Candida] boidinii]